MGGIVSVAAVAWRVPGHFSEILHEGHSHNKLSLGEAEWSWEERTIPTVLAYSLVHYLTKFVTFQDAVQRYLAVPSHKVSTLLLDWRVELPVTIMSVHSAFC